MVKQARPGGRQAPPKAAARAVRLGSLAQVRNAIVACERCPRLREHCLAVARERKRAFRDQVYWGKPVPGFIPSIETSTSSGPWHAGRR